jgi:hypothetical protein
VEYLENRVAPAVCIWSSTNNPDDHWTTAKNWSTNSVPTRIDDVTFNNTDNVGSEADGNNSWSIQKFTMAGYSGRLILYNPVIAAGKGSSITSGVIAGNHANFANDLNIAGGGTLSGGTFQDQAELLNSTASTLTINGAATFNAGELENVGTINWTSGNLTFQNKSVLQNTSMAGTTDLQGDIGITDDGTGQLTNVGTIQKLGGTGTSDFSTLGTFINDGTLDSDSGTIAVPASVKQVGKMGSYLSAGVISDSATLANSGTLYGIGTFKCSVTNGGSISVGSFVKPTGTLSISGNLTQQTGATIEMLSDASGNVSLLKVTGSAQLAGILNFTRNTMWLPQLGSTFTIMTYAGRGTSSMTVNVINATWVAGGVNCTFGSTIGMTGITLTVVKAPSSASRFVAVGVGPGNVAPLSIAEPPSVVTGATASARRADTDAGNARYAARLPAALRDAADESLQWLNTAHSGSQREGLLATDALFALASSPLNGIE